MGIRTKGGRRLRLGILGVTAGLGISAGLACATADGNRPSSDGGNGGRDGRVIVEPGTPPTDPQTDVAFFVSGHSLTDDPLASDVVATATSLGFASEFNEQIGIGSPIRIRTRGTNADSTGWSGYSTGKNREGTGMNVITELSQHATISGPYDALVITERHDIVGTLLWENTVRYLRHFHDRLLDGNPNGTTYVYHSWLPITSRSDLQPFIDYERTMYPVWECIAERVQLSLTAEGSSSHVVAIAAGIALTDLLEAALAGDVPGISGGSTEDVTGRIFGDAGSPRPVHLSRVGIYFESLVTFASIFHRSPEGATAPAGIDAATATALQALAWTSVSNHHHATPRGMAACRAYMRDVACDAYGEYHTADAGMIGPCKMAFADNATGRPFHYDAASDAQYWFPDP